VIADPLGIFFAAESFNDLKGPREDDGPMPLFVPLKGVPFAAPLWGQCDYEIGPRTQNASEFRFCGLPVQRAASYCAKRGGQFAVV
jgi:hypothetical protein